LRRGPFSVVHAGLNLEVWFSHTLESASQPPKSFGDQSFGKHAEHFLKDFRERLAGL
jgi:hypothetical protein